MIDFVESMAAAMWKEDAMRAAPNVGRHRTPDEFAVQAQPVRDRWHGYARAAMRAVADQMPADYVLMIGALRLGGQADEADAMTALAMVALQKGGGGDRVTFSRDPDQRPILGQRGAGLRAEPEMRVISDPPRPDDPVPELTYLGQPECDGRGSVPDDYGFCRECGSPMKLEVAAETRVLCSACGWSVT